MKNKIIPALIIGFILLSFRRTNAAVLNDDIFRISFLGNANLPRGQRNNNPGNLKISNSNWQGKIPVSQNTDGTFEQFETYALGTRAMIKLLSNYMTVRGLQTLDEIIKLYAPNSENDSEAYIGFIENKTGLNRFAALSPTKEILRKLVISMSEFENGVEAVDSLFFDAAYNLL